MTLHPRTLIRFRGKAKPCSCGMLQEKIETKQINLKALRLSRQPAALQYQRLELMFLVL